MSMPGPLLNKYSGSLDHMKIAVDDREVTNLLSSTLDVVCCC
jgi:hypothetical protein